MDAGAGGGICSLVERLCSVLIATSSFFTFDVELFLRFASLSTGLISLPSAFLFAIGHDSPRNFPLLATPTPHVNVVLYPEHSLPRSMHCVQYGLLRSHLTPRFLHAKQSSAAPPVPVLRLRFLGDGATVGPAFESAKGCCVGAWAVDAISGPRTKLQSYQGSNAVGTLLRATQDSMMVPVYSAKDTLERAALPFDYNVEKYDCLIDYLEAPPFLTLRAING